MSDSHKPAFGEMNLAPTSHPAYPPMLLNAVMVIHFIMTAFPPRRNPCAQILPSELRLVQANDFLELVD
jgi:hypothetical protein